MATRLHDSWSDELALTVDHVDPGPIPEPPGPDLPPRLRHLRDSSRILGPSEHTLRRRRERIEQLERRVRQIEAYLVEVDKYRTHAASGPCDPMVRDHIDAMLDRHVRRLIDLADTHRSVIQHLRGVS